MKIEKFTDGYVILGDCTDQSIISFLEKEIEKVGLIIADPPYGKVVHEKWDQTLLSAENFSNWMISWTRLYTDHLLLDGGAFYIWGGIGSPGFRPFMYFLHDAEIVNKFELANLITWKKKRAYGVSHNYLFTREECAYFIKGNAKKPRKFHIPLLDQKRGYAGFKAKYPAKSEFYRRTNVWTDITEKMQNKLHPTEKQQKLYEIMIDIHTDQNEWIIDPFAGSGAAAFAARKLNRKFVVIEKDEQYFENIVQRLVA